MRTPPRTLAHRVHAPSTASSTRRRRDGNGLGRRHRAPVICLTLVLRAAVEPPQQVPQLRLEGAVALRTAQPSGLAEILERGAARGARHVEALLPGLRRAALPQR